MGWFNYLMHLFMQRKLRKLAFCAQNPHQIQLRQLLKNLNKARNTEAGKRYGFQEIKTIEDFKKAIPVTHYEEIRNDVLRMMHGERNVLWPGKVTWFAKSSGTTSDRSKFIPVPRENLYGSHFKASWYTTALVYKLDPQAQLFRDKSLVMGGTVQTFQEHPETTFGDVSGIMLRFMPSVGRPFYTPDFETALLADWSEKIERMAQMSSKQNVTMIGGVPTWTIVLLNRILALTGKENILEVWPNLRTYTHGGVGFKPYRETFRNFIPKDDFNYMEIYNASEGFFATQDRFGADDMFLFTDNNIFYEFLPVSEWDAEHPESVTLEDVEVGRQYALVITTNGGLWRYTPGDTIQFTRKNPYRIQVTGRTQQFINAFGEEVMIANTDQAIARTSEDLNVRVSDYTVAPVYLEKDKKGGHEWLIEFDKPPEDLHVFETVLDRHLQQLNSDYEAKRFQDMALECLRVKVMPKGTFQEWMASKGKLGGQHKVPRLANDRKIINEIISFMESTT